MLKKNLENAAKNLKINLTPETTKLLEQEFETIDSKIKKMYKINVDNVEPMQWVGSYDKKNNKSFSMDDKPLLDFSKIKMNRDIQENLLVIELEDDQTNEQ